MTIKINLPQEVEDILTLLERHGFDSYVVGGAVRDSIIGRKVKDWDITTNAKPNEIIKVFSNNRKIITGIRYGTVSIVINDQNFEVTTYRIDGEYKDGRHPENVKFVGNLLADLARRDFTINAMAYYPEILVDPFNGYEDIQNGIIRCVGNPNDRFEEDALRMMRAIRFSCNLGFTIEEQTQFAIFNNADKIKNVSIERIRDEFDKILLHDGLRALLLSGLLDFFLPEFRELVEVNQYNKYHKYTVMQHTLFVVKDVRSNLVLKLAALFHDFGKPSCKIVGEDGFDHFYGHPKVSAEMAETIMRRMKYDNNTINKVVTLVAHHDIIPVESKKSVKKLLNKLGEELFFNLLDLKIADIKAHSEESQYQLPFVDTMRNMANNILEEEECFTLKDLAINGNDLIDLGMKPDRMFSIILNNLLDMVINEELENTREILLGFIQ